MFALLVLGLTGMVVAQYGVPADPASAYAPAAPVYAPQPVVLPEMPAAHEILYPRRHKHHRHGHRHSSSSSSESREHRSKCNKCTKLTKTCPPLVNECFPADVKYLTYKGCKVAYAECSKKQFTVGLFGGEGELLVEGDQFAAKLIKCKGREWIDHGKKVKLERVYCRYQTPGMKSLMPQETDNEADEEPATEDPAEEDSDNTEQAEDDSTL